MPFSHLGAAELLLRSYLRSWPFIFSGMLLLIGLMLRLSEVELVHRLRSMGFDALVRIYPRDIPEDSPIALLAIDQASLDRFGQWPWSRHLVAELTAEVARAKAGIVIFDINFAQADRLAPARLEQALGIELPQEFQIDPDQAFADALGAFPSVLASFSRLQDQLTPLAENQAASTAPKTRFPAGYFAIGEDPSFNVPAAPAFSNPLPQLTEASFALGSAMSASDRDGILRRVPSIIAIGEPGALQTELRFFLSIEALRVATGTAQYNLESHASPLPGTPKEMRGLRNLTMGQWKLPVDRKGYLLLYESRKPGAEIVSVSDLLSDDPAVSMAAREALAGKVVFAAPRVFGLGDRAIGSLGVLRQGVDFHVLLAEQILARQYLKEPNWVRFIEAAVLASVGLGLLSLLLLRRLSLVWQFVAGVFILLTPLAGSWLAFQYLNLGPIQNEPDFVRPLVDGLWPTLVGSAVFLSAMTGRAFQTELSQRTLRQTFQRYLSPKVVQALDTDAGLSLFDPQERVITIMFVDVRGFTTLSERLSAAESIRLVNAFLASFTAAIQQEDGTVDKFLGDGVMAFWNAPIEQEDHRTRALRAAKDILSRVEALNQELLTSEAWANVMQGQPLKVGVGLHTGPASVGNFGSDDRLDYSAIGDTVNTAARIEGLCKDFGESLLLSRSVVEEITDDLKPLGPASIRGRVGQIELFSVNRDKKPSTKGLGPEV